MHARRRFLRNLLALTAAVPALAKAARAPSPNAGDFDALWQAINDDYAYLAHAAAWRAASARWRPRAVAARSAGQFLATLEGLIAELNDDHVTLDEHLPGSPRPIPTATDLWAEWIGQEAVISAVRAGSVADVAGAVPGMRVTAIQDLPVAQSVGALLRGARRDDPQARNWALRRRLAGPWTGTLRLEVVSAGQKRRLDIERADLPDTTIQALVVHRIGPERDLGYLRVKNSLGDEGLIALFDAALLRLKDTRGLILDLRETQSGGQSLVASALMGRFVTTERPCIIRAPRGAKVGTATPAETVKPRGPFAYTAPTLVLVDRWTAGEGESLAIGLNAAAAATLVGTSMAGLRGDRRTMRLPFSKIGLRYPDTRVFHVDGTPREAVRPAVDVNIVAPSGGPGDPILYQALKILEALPARADRPRG